MFRKHSPRLQALTVSLTLSLFFVTCRHMEATHLEADSKARPPSMQDILASSEAVTGIREADSNVPAQGELMPLRWKTDEENGGEKTRLGSQGGVTITLVVPKTREENTNWIEKHLSHWNRSVYEVDNPDAELSVPLNKGRESMVYLTYIIDNYDSLPQISIFHHAARFQWHNDDPDYDSLPNLQRLRIPYVMAEGYANLRCTWGMGCPSEIRPRDDYKKPTTESNGSPHVRGVYLPAFQQLFPDQPVPEVVATACCAQFAVTRDTIRQHPRSRYVQWRNWLMDSELEDSLSGRVFEYSWHIIFGKDHDGVYCPEAKTCVCGMYGLCGNESRCDERGCEGRFVMPKYSNLPEGWPLKGWSGEDRRWVGELP